MEHLSQDDHMTLSPADEDDIELVPDEA